MTAIPERIMQEAESISDRINYVMPAPEAVRLAISEAILAAEERATLRERERCAAMAKGIGDVLLCANEDSSSGHLMTALAAAIMQKENGE